MTLTAADLDRIERLALAQAGKEFGTAVALLPGEVLELVRRARLAPPDEPMPTEPVDG